MTRRGVAKAMRPSITVGRWTEVARILDGLQRAARVQVIIATHSPILMALPGVQLVEITRHGIAPEHYRDTHHCRLYQDFTVDPEQFLADALRKDLVY